MSGRNSENTEQLSIRARLLLNQQVKEKLTANRLERKSSMASPPQLATASANRVSVAGARRRLRAEWAELKGDVETDSTLVGVVALVCVQRESRAVGLRAALAAMGATVVLRWSMLVTHLVWQHGADREVRVLARRLNCHVVSPKWVEACASNNTRAPEKGYRAPLRPSDSPDLAHLTRMLRIADKENLPGDKASKQPKAAPNMRRKLFSNKEDDNLSSLDSDEDGQHCTNPYVLQAKGRKKAKKPARPQSNIQNSVQIVLSGVTRSERVHLMSLAKSLGWAVGRSVSARTTHVLVGRGRRTLAALQGAARGCWVLHDKYLYLCSLEGQLLPPEPYQLEELVKISSRGRMERAALQWPAYSVCVFDGRRVRVRRTAPHGPEVADLLRLCGAQLLGDGEEGHVDVTICSPSECEPIDGVSVVSQWVTDSVAAGRMRNTRRYTTQHVATHNNTQHVATQNTTQHVATQDTTQHVATQNTTQHVATQDSTQHVATHETPLANPLVDCTNIVLNTQTDA